MLKRFCDKDIFRFRSRSAFSVCSPSTTHRCHWVCFLFLFAISQCQTLDDSEPKLVSSCTRAEQHYRLNVRCKETFTFSSKLNMEKTWTETDSDAMQNNKSDHLIFAYKNCHCRFASDFMMIRMWNSTIDGHPSVNKYHIEFTSLWHIHVLQEFSCRSLFAFISSLFPFDADEAYEGISSHLIF